MYFKHSGFLLGRKYFEDDRKQETGETTSPTTRRVFTFPTANNPPALSCEAHRDVHERLFWNLEVRINYRDKVSLILRQIEYPETP